MGEPASIDIRPAGPGDEETVVEIDSRVTHSPEKRRYHVEAVHAGHCLLAYFGHEPVGYAVWNRTFFGLPFIWLLFVRPDQRRLGIGSALIQHISHLCLSEKLFTSTNESNQRMHRLLPRLGFIRSGFIDNLDEGDPEIVYVRLPRSSSPEGDHVD
jgi:GNAT superfamily N-acetyltransferase